MTGSPLPLRPGSRKHVQGKPNNDAPVSNGSDPLVPSTGGPDSVKVDSVKVDSESNRA